MRIPRRGFLGAIGAIIAAPFLPTPVRTVTDQLWWLKVPTDGWRLHVADSPTYEFGFTGFQPHRVSGALRFTMVCPAPRLQRQIYGRT